mgnify:CR=1 FL=1
MKALRETCSAISKPVSLVLYAALILLISERLSIDLIAIIQALIIVFIAAPLLVRAIFPWGFRRGGGTP